MLEVQGECAHDVEEVPGDPDWGRCRLCGDDGFPMTDAAAYGPVDCSTCKDTGLVPVALTGTLTDKRGQEYDASAAFADAACPDCREEFAVLGRAHGSQVATLPKGSTY
jgi:hypothetical protein